MKDSDTPGGSRDDNLGYGDRAVALRPEEDFSADAATKREAAKQIDYRETRREIDRKVGRLKADTSTVAPSRGAVSQRNIALSYYEDQARKLTDAERRRRDIPDFGNLPSVKAIIDQAAADGVTLTSEQLRQMADFGVLNAAADRVIAAARANNGKGDRIGITNVYTTLESANPVMASILPSIVESKLAEAAQDPSVVADILEKVGGVINWVLTPLVAANNWSTEGVRAGSLRVNENLQGGGIAFGPLSFAQGFVSADDRARVQDGAFNEAYVQQLREATNDDGSPRYSPKQVDIALEVMTESVTGNPDAIMSVWRTKYAGDEEAAQIFRDIMYSRSTGPMQELLRQLDSAHLGNTGQVSFGAADTTAVFDPARGGETRQDLANVAGMAIAIAYDPTLYLGRTGKALKAAMWGIERLAPGVPVAEVLGKARYGRLPIGNPVYRYFNTLATYLNRLEDLDATALKAGKAARETTDEAAKKAAVARKMRAEQDAASLRQRMSRQFDELPDDLIDDFRNSPWKNADGKFDVEHIAAHLDDANDAYVTALGDISDKIAAAGATRAALFQAAMDINADNMATPAARKLIQADLADAIRAENKLNLERSALRSVDQRIGGRTLTRSALVPRLSMVGRARIAAVNQLSMMLMPQEQAFRLVDDFLANSGDAAVFGEALNAAAMPLGQAVRKQKFSPAGFGDSLGRMFSSIAATRRFNIATGEDSLQVYRYARSFYPKRTAEFIADMYRKGDSGSRREIVIGLVRGAMASRGLVVTKREAEEAMLGLKPQAEQAITGSMLGEQYAVSVPVGMLPSQKAAAVAAGNGEAVPPAGLWKSLSSDAEGTEHAIHLAQTADYVAVPSLRDMEQMRNGVRVALGNGAEKITNLWSLGTLFGLRFSIRNAIEEIGLYWLLGGKALDLYRGRKLDQAIRKVRPLLTVVDGPNGPEVAYQKSLLGSDVTALGMVASRAQRLSRWVESKGLPEWMAEMIYRPLNEDEIKAAGVALSQGNTEAFAHLAIRSLATQRVFGLRTNLTTEQDRLAFNYLVDSTHGMALLDEIGEAGTYLQSGGYPAYVDNMYGITDTMPGVEFGTLPDVKFGAYGNIPALGRDNGKDIYGLGFWWRELQTTLDGDGPIGAAAVAGLRNPAAAKKQIADIIRNDREFGYKEKFTRIRSDADVDEFASNYFENVFQHFTKADGTLNGDLQARFLVTDPDTGKTTATWWDQLEDGTLVPRVNRAYLNDYKVTDRPDYIFGREVQTYVPNAANDTAFFGDRAFAWMGRQNSRISRDPLFLANYLDQFKKSSPQRDSLANALARKRAEKSGTDVEVSDADRALADEVYARQAMDQAFSVTLAYLDNPANRSNMAWKVRNASRYYRATEDFYRRMSRVVKHDPVALWKGALTYQLLQDNGFTYTNDNGEAYFAYPLNNLATGAVIKALGIFNVNVRQYADLDPFSLTGRVTGLTPSLDPQQGYPTLSGPVATPVAGVLAAFPSLAGIRTVLLGQYSKTTGNAFADMVKMWIPAGVSKMISASDNEQIDAQIAGAAFDTVALMTAEGMLDVLTVNGEPLDIDPAKVDFSIFSRTDQYQAAQKISTSYFFSKLIFSYWAAANPQMGGNTASEFAKQNGIDSIDDAYYDLLDMHSGDPNAMQLALADWYAAKIPAMNGNYDGWDSLLPFTTSATKFDKTAHPGAAIASVRATDQLHKWLQRGETEDLFTRFGEAAWFLAPKDGEFTWDSHALMTTTLGLKVSKTEAERYDELFALQGRTTEFKIKRDYDAAIAEETNPEAIKALQEEKKRAVDANRQLNPKWAIQAGTMDSTRNPVMTGDLLEKTRQMLDYLKQRNGSLTSDEQMIANAIDIYTDYKSQADGLKGSSAQKRAFKASLAQRMDAEFAIVRNESANAAEFIDGVLGTDPNYLLGMD